MGQIEKERAPWIVEHIEPQVVGRTYSTGEELPILRLIVKFAAGFINAFPVIRPRYHIPEAVLEVLGASNIGGIGGREHILEHDSGHPWAKRIFRVGIFGPIPVGKRKTGIAAELAANLLEPADIAAMPDHEPPVAVRA